MTTAPNEWNDGEAPAFAREGPERWAAAMQLFEAALERPVAERAAFLVTASDDTELRAKVAALLAAEQKSSPFLEPEAGGALRAVALARRLGDHDLLPRLSAALGDGYRVTRELEGGGMSRVFVAEEVRLGRQVAVKVLPTEFARPQVAERFHREARLIASLRHPHIVPLLAAGESEDGLLYYTMPYLEGESLARRLAREGRLPLAQVLAIASEVAEALEYAHARGVIHRDIKPANVLMEGQHALVADFGIAKGILVDDRRDDASGAGSPRDAGNATLTAAGFVLGTPAYMSPEQSNGGRVDARSDVYSFGCLVFELLTGKRPFVDAEAASLGRRATDPAPSVRAHVADLPVDIDTALACALSPLPDERYASAAAFAHALHEASAPKPSVIIPAKLAWSRQRVTVVAVGVVLLLAGAVELARRLSTSAPDGAVAAQRSVAVLPFQNVGPPGDSYLADGVAEELTSRLTSLEGLRVISSNSAREYRGTTKSPVQVGRELGAAYLLQGRVRWDTTGVNSGKVRVTTELVRTSDGSAVWNERYDAVAGDVLDIEARIAEHVATSLQLALGTAARQTLAARPTEDFEAYSDFLKGEALRTVPEGASGSWVQAIAEYDRAIARDPRFALAYARLSEVSSRLAHNYGDPDQAHMERARTAAETAVRLAPGLAEAHLASGYYHYYARRDYAKAQEELTRALASQPGRAEILLARAYVLRRQGRFAEAASNLARAVELEPRSAQAAWDLAGTYSLMRQFSEAMPYYDRAIALSPGFASAYADKARRLVSWKGDTAAARQVVRDAFGRVNAGDLMIRINTAASVLIGDGPVEREALSKLNAASFADDTVFYQAWTADWARLRGDSIRRHAYADSALRRVEPLMAAHPGEWRIRSTLAQIYAFAGRKREALDHAYRALRDLPPTTDAIDRPNFLEAVAYVEALVGAPDSAIARLEYLLSVPSELTVTRLRVDPRWDALRGEPRFQRLVR